MAIFWVFFHQSCATGTRLLQKEIYLQKLLPNLRQLVFCRLLKTSIPFIRGRLILSRPLFWFVQTSPRLHLSASGPPRPPRAAPAACACCPACLPSDGHPLAPSCARQSPPVHAAPACACPFLSACSFLPSYPSLPAPAPAACACCRSRAYPRLFAVRWSPACAFLRQSAPSAPAGPAVRTRPLSTHASF